MKKSKRIRYYCLLLGLIITTSCCSCSGVNKKTSHQSTAEVRPIIDSSITPDVYYDVAETSSNSRNVSELSGYDISDPDQVVAFLEAELGAQKTTIESMKSGDENAEYWTSGFYIDENALPPLAQFGVRGLINDKEVLLGMADLYVFPHCSSFHVFRHCFINEFENGRRRVADKNYETDRIICYCKYSLAPNKNLETFYDDVTKRDVSTDENQQVTTFIGYISFINAEDAIDYFEAYVDRYMNHYTDNYVEEYQERKAEVENLSQIPNLFVNGCKNPDAHILSRKIYYTDDLPEEVYFLDKDKHEGHFTFSTNNKEAHVYDFLYGKNPLPPPYINVIETGTSFTLMLKGNVVVGVIMRIGPNILLMRMPQ